MKQTFLLLPFALLFFACKKETTEKNKAAYSAGLHNSVSRYRYSQTVSVDFKEFNSCTQEYVHITGLWKYHVRWVIVNNFWNYTYEFNYDSVKGIGLTTGLRYKGTGHVTDHEQSTWNGETWELKKTSITNKIIFTSPGGNNFSSYAFYHFAVNSNGALTVDHSRYRFNYCQ